MIKGNIKRLKRRLKRFLEHRLTEPLLRFLSRRSLPQLQRWGMSLGALIYRLNTKSAQVTRRNISLVYPELDHEAQEKRIQSSLQETLKTGLELGWCWMAPMDQVLGHVRQIHGLDMVKSIHESDNGIIVLGPHLGNWEIFGLLLNEILPPFSAMYAVPKNLVLEPIIFEGRCRSGMTMVPANMKGVAHLLKKLKAGEAVGNLPDQEPDDRSSGIFAPFMGVEALSPKLVSRLISKTGAKVVAGFAERLPDGQGFDIHFIAADDGIYSTDEREAITAMNRTVEQLVAIAPEQYQWEYKRFKARPEGEGKIY